MSAHSVKRMTAAVAATEAARELGDDADNDTARENAFREDLDDAVRPTPAPRRPVTSGTRTERPRPAPLKLVAAQRVDVPRAAPRPASAGPVVPRRFARDTMRESEVQSDFNRFAEERGAKGLADLLEAAAAYTAFVEGDAQFSRPQVMRKVREYSPETFNREDVLQTFGTLIDEGRIEEADDGRFSIAEDTRFRPDARRSAG